MARPPKITDALLRGVIDELRRNQTTLTGTAVREELKRRFGVRAGTQRVYRLIREPPSPPPLVGPVGDLVARVRELEAALAAAVQRAELAEHREQAHQDRWANEIHALREEVRRLRGGR